MKFLYCDCFSGVSGDMLLGALLDAGVKEEELRRELAKLGLEKEYTLRVTRVVKKGISATDVQVELHEHHHEHEHTSHQHNHHHLRNLVDIVNIIDHSGLSTEIKTKCKYVFQRLAQAEATVHGTSIDKVHFHEVGAVDAIVDICGTVIALSLLGIEKIISSPLPTGSGFVECAHGIIPVPAPATAELLKNVPIYDPGIVGELVTPTGASLITSLADDYGTLPAAKISVIGYGAGNKDFGIPNVLRIFVGESAEKNEPSSSTSETVYVLETTVDDCSPEILGYLWEKVFAAGALDMYYSPVYAKKGRPATLITILASEDQVHEITKTIFCETSTIGLRIMTSSRLCLEREIKTIKTSFGEVKFKISGSTAKPEFEELKEIANKYKLSLKEVYNKVIAEYENNN